jgi:hypothetical protein
MMLMKHMETLDRESLEARGKDMQRLSDAVHAVMTAHGLAKGNCTTICREVVEIGPDGVPRPRLVCETIC